MLLAHRDIYCGVFDSTIIRNGITESDLRTVECFELEIFHSTGGTSYINGEKYPIKEGMFICAKPKQIRHSLFPVKCSFIRVFNNEYVPKEIANVLSSLPNCTYITDQSEVEFLLAQMSNLKNLFTSTNVNTSEQILINSLFYSILYKLMSITKGEKDKPIQKDIKKIALDAYIYINENLSSDCSLQTIADAVNVSPNYLQNVFTKSFGISPYKYTIIKRIEKAKKMIIVGDKSMFEIASDLGFCSQSHFNSIFKKITGETPLEYRTKTLEHPITTQFNF